MTTLLPEHNAAASSGAVSDAEDHGTGLGITIMRNGCKDFISADADKRWLGFFGKHFLIPTISRTGDQMIETSRLSVAFPTMAGEIEAATRRFRFFLQPAGDD